MRTVIGIACLLSAKQVLAQQDAKDLAKLDLDQLMNIEVTAATKKLEKLQNIASAVFVINQDDIKHSGARTIPELLRLVPGFEVAQISGNAWRVSARGFNAGFGNKLLVLVDGRNVYTQLHNGVYWESLNILLDDIERIEVVRGPGGALWGSNAVNGVVNIITKSALDTSEDLVKVSYGSSGLNDNAFRLVRRVGDASVRTYGMFQETPETRNMKGNANGDTTKNMQGGFRLDSVKDSGQYTLQGDIYSIRETQNLGLPDVTVPGPKKEEFDYTNHGASLMGKLQRKWSESVATSLQIYFDTFYRPMPQLEEGRNTFDVDFTGTSKQGKHSLTVGANYRTSKGNTVASEYTVLSPSSRTIDIWSLYGQDEITLKKGLSLALGGKAEHNSISRLEFQPTARLLFSKSDRESYWLAASSSVRIPGQAELDSQAQFYKTTDISSGLPVLVKLIGSSAFKPERASTFESGARFVTSKNLTLDVSTYLSHYSSLRSFTNLTPSLLTSPVTYILQPVQIDNHLSGDTAGIELSVRFQPMARLRMSGSYAYTSLRLSYDRGHVDALDLYGDDGRGEGPRHSASIMANYDCMKGWATDVSLFYKDHDIGGTGQANISWNFRISYAPSKAFDIAFVGCNFGSSTLNIPTGRLHEIFGASLPSARLEARWHF